MQSQSAQPPDRPGRSSQPIRLVAIDVDGTLLRSDKQLTRRNGQVIRKARDRGVKVVLASARPPRSLRSIYQALELDTLTINYNGALIYDPQRARQVRHQPLPLETAQKVIAQARKLDPKVVVSLEVLDKWYTDFVDQSLPTETSLHFMPDYVGPLEAILRTPVTKLMLLAPPERLAGITQRIREQFAGQVMLAISDAHLLQVNHPEVDKGRSLEYIAGHYGVSRAQVMAIGDAPNDLGMLRWAGMGVAMGNAWDSVRHIARVVVASNDQDGVAEAIERYVLDGHEP